MNNLPANTPSPNSPAAEFDYEQPEPVTADLPGHTGPSLENLPTSVSAADIAAEGKKYGWGGM